ncbi:ABC transporter substrate-binding protein [Microlunatus parietis]|uniref:Multiple sugar transport system substrate-binding protein n=1 Tax=Microlunatus parietis TaxID=682979 RepID=A0A7Y9IEV1_9ACTN|nr:extracellular solute-binding protein [Microlunatus parietis]NYE75515.1 multiple sugar transport system substrate-binding protein [Microlunatus parietis]
MKRAMMRNLLAAGALATFALATACSGPQPEPSGPVQLRMAIWSANEGHLDLFESIAADYVAEHGGQVSGVTFETLTGTSYISALTTQIAGGNSPDLAWVQETNAGEFVGGGVLHDLAPTLAETPDYDLPDVLPAALDLWRKGDAVYAYPFSNSPFGMYANLDLLQAAGQPTPDELIKSGDWNWDKVAEIAAATAQQTGKGGLTVPWETWDQLAPWWAGWGAAGWSADGATCTFTSPEMKEFFGWLHRGTYQTGAMIKPGDSLPFAGGEAAFSVGQLSMSGSLDGFAWDFVPLPAGPKATVNMVGQAGVGVIARGPNPDRAADFLAYFTDKTQGAQLATFFPPPRTSLLTVDTFKKAAPKLSEQQIQRTILDVVPKATTKPGHPRFSQFTDLVKKDLDVAFAPDGDIGAALDQVCTDLQPLLQTN